MLPARPTNLLIALLLFCAVSSFPQDRAKDTAAVHKQLQEARSLYNSGQVDSATFIAQHALSLSTSVRYHKGRGKALLLLGACLSRKPEMRDSVHALVTEATRIAQSLGDTLLLLQAHKLNGHAYYMSQEWAKSMEHYQKALKLAESAGNKREIASACRQIGVAYISMGLDGNAMGLKYYQRAFRIYDELKDTGAVAGMYFVMGIAYNNIGDLEQGKICQEQLIRYCKLLGDEACVARSQNELAGYYAKYGMKEKALALLRDSYQRLKKLPGYKEELANTCLKICMYLKDLNRLNETLPYLEEQLALSQEIKNTSLEREAYESLSFYYEYKRDYKRALLYNRKFVEALRALHRGELPRQMAEMEAKYQTEKKQAQIEGLEKEKQQQARLTAVEKKKQQIIIVSIAAGLALVIVFSFFLYKRFKITQKQARIIERQKQLVEEKQKELLDSIHYARRIQRSLLPTEKYIVKKLGELGRKPAAN
jgi:tetratricopeptide (TPR) repeat protein